MKNHTTAARRPPETPARAAHPPLAAGARSPRRSARASCLCLFALLAFALLTLGGARRASAQTKVETYATAYGERPGEGCKSTLVLGAASGPLQESPATAEAFSFIFVPRSGSGGNLVFSVYSFGVERFRDDDEGQPALIPYDPNGIRQNLVNFFGRAGCPLNDSAADAIAGFLNRSETGLSVERFRKEVQAAAPASFANIRLVQSEEGNVLWPDQESFGNFVSRFGNTVRIPANAQVIEVLRQLGGQNVQVMSLSFELAALRRQVSLMTLGGGALLLVILTLLALVYAGQKFRLKIPWVNLGRKPQPRTAPRMSPEAAAALQKIIDDSRKLFEQDFLYPQKVKEIFLQLQAAVRGFDKQYYDATPEGLSFILRDSAEEFQSYGSLESTKYKNAYENLVRGLVDYVQRNAPAAEAADKVGGATDTKPAEATPGEMKSVEAPPQEAETTPPTAVGGESSEAVTQGAAGDVQGNGEGDLLNRFVVELDRRFNRLERNLVGELSGHKTRVGELCEVWSEPNDPVPDGALDQVLERSRKARAALDTLRRRFGHQDLTLEQSDDRINLFLNGLDEIRDTYLKEQGAELTTLEEVPAAIRGKLADSETLRDKLQDYDEALKETRETFGELVRPHEDVFEAAQRIASDQVMALSLHPQYRGETPASITEVVKQLGDNLGKAQDEISTIETTLKPVLSEPADSVVEMVRSLVTSFEEAKSDAARAAELEAERDTLEEKLQSVGSEARQGEELARLILDRLAFKSARLDGDATPVATTIGKLSDQSPVYWRLRCGLSAARDALAESLADGTRADVVEALSLGVIERKLTDLLENMQEFSGDELWRKGIESGFTNGWMHDLLRADLLLQNYYAEDWEFALLRDSLGAARVFLEAAMHEHRVRVVPVKAFEPKPDGMERIGPDEKLLSLGEVRRRVTEVYRAKHRTEGFVVDAKQFSLVIDGSTKATGKVVLMSPVDWGV